MLNNIKNYDLMYGMKLGERQAKILYDFLMENFNTESYKCETNGLVSIIKGTNDNGLGYTIEVEERKWTSNRLTIVYGDYVYIGDYNTVREFKVVVGEVQIPL